VWFGSASCPRSSGTEGIDGLKEESTNDNEIEPFCV
jgi:hypothetical protein